MSSSVVPSIQEVLLCPFLFEDLLHVAVVLRRGRQFYLITILRNFSASVSSSEDGVLAVSRHFSMPCRVLDGEEGTLLAHKTIVADYEGQPFYRL